MRPPRFDQLHRQPGPWFVALGGAGMFGANFYLYGSGGEWIAIDCGFALKATKTTLALFRISGAPWIAPSTPALLLRG